MDKPKYTVTIQLESNKYIEFIAEDKKDHIFLIKKVTKMFKRKKTAEINVSDYGYLIDFSRVLLVSFTQI